MQKREFDERTALARPDVPVVVENCTTGKRYEIVHFALSSEEMIIGVEETE